MNKKHIIRMRTKILLLCIGCTLLALCLQTLFFQHSASSIIYSQGQEASLNSLENMQDELGVWVTSYENNMIKIYYQSNFVQDLGKSMAPSDLQSEYRLTAYNMFMTEFDTSQDVDALYIYDMNNNLISSYRSANTPLCNYPEDIFKNPLATNAGVVSKYVDSDNKVMLVSSYYNSSRSENIIRFVLKIYSNNATKKIGYIVCDADVNSFLRIVEKYSYSNSQIVWLQPKGDRPVFCYGNPVDGEVSYYNTLVAKIQKNALTDQSGKSMQPNLFFEIPQKDYNLIAFSLTPPYMQNESEHALQQNMLIIAIIVILVALVSALLVTRSLTTPLIRIERTLIKIRNGQTDLRLTDLKPDEIGELGEAINDMLDENNKLITQQYSSKLLLKQAEYKALQAQVNPHFLYNSLDTMSSIATSQQCHTVSLLCQAMSNVFRYSIDMKEPLSTIESEILHIKSYMYVMNVRMQNSIEIEISVDRGLLQEKVPRLSIQPVVENAIRHGLRNKHGAKKILIDGIVRDGTIVLSITDNGVGMDADKINQNLQDSPTEALDKKDSIGLSNINARIRLFFGEPYGVFASSVIGEYTTISLRVPLGNKESCK
jgi:sensor histidine kinase YesM